jgi:hypothetical protein
MSSARRGPEIAVRRGLTSLAWIRWLNKRASQRLAVKKRKAGGAKTRSVRPHRRLFLPSPSLLPLCLSASEPLPLTMRRCDATNLLFRASHLIARGAPPVLCTCSRGKVSLKNTLNMASPIPVPLPRNSSSDPILVSAESSGREADRFNTSQ